jgi:hypothetical protein
MTAPTSSPVSPWGSGRYFRQLLQANFESLVLATMSAPTKSPVSPLMDIVPTACDQYVLLSSNAIGAYLTVARFWLIVLITTKIYFTKLFPSRSFVSLSGHRRPPLERAFPMSCPPSSWEAGCNVIHSQRLRLKLRPLRLPPIKCGRTSSLWFYTMPHSTKSPAAPFEESLLLRRSILDSCALSVNRVNNTNLL